MPPSRPNQFARLLAAAGWSQAEAARRLQITPGAVSQICNGKTQPRPSTLNLLKLMVGNENPKALAQQERYDWKALDRWERELLQELRRLSQSERDRLLPIFRQMIKAMLN